MSKPGTIYSPSGDDGSDVNVHYIKKTYISTHVVQLKLAHGHPNSEERNFSHSLKIKSVHIMICLQLST